MKSQNILTCVTFSTDGTTIAVGDINGFIYFYTFNYQNGNYGHIQPYKKISAYKKGCVTDVIFSNELLCCIGHDTIDNENIKIYNYTNYNRSTALYSFKCHEYGTLCCDLYQRSNLLITGGSKGEIVIIELNTFTILHTIQVIDSGAIQCISIDQWNSQFFIGTEAGDIICYNINNFEILYQITSLYTKSIFFNHPADLHGLISSFGVTAINVTSDYIYVAGSNGSIKLIYRYHQKND